MLKQEDNSEMPTQSKPQATVSEARVTPEELTDALAAIEARRQAEASRIAGTIPLGQAVSELHLDSTTDEIWTEVQAQRSKAAEAKSAAAQQEQAYRPQAVQQVPPTLSRTSRRRRWISVFAPFVLVWVLFHNNLTPHFGNTHPLTSTSTISTAPPILRSFDLVPDGKEVYADDASLMQISEGKPLSKIIVSENHTRNRWTLVKTSGHVYLRGYIADSDSLQPLQGKALNVYNDDNSGELHGETTSNITLRVDNVPLQKSSGDDDFSGITVSNFQPDPLTTLSPWH